MYRVLLVDDEAAVLEMLLSTIPWNQFGVEEILTAKNGIQALEQMQRQNIDLLVTDIRMPNMDGLELLEKVCSLYPGTRFVILSAYSDFEYARRALQLGAENYLLKPLQERELEETIETALNNIYADRKDTNQVFRDNIVRRWLENNITLEELGERCRLLDVNIYLPRYCVACIRWKFQEGYLQSYQNRCIQKLKELKYEVYPIWDKFGYFAIIVGGRLSSQKQLGEILVAAAEEVGCFNDMIAAVGCFVTKCQELFLSHRSACRLLETVDISAGHIRLSTSEEEVSADNIWVIEQVNMLFHQQEESVRRQGFRNLAQKLITDRDEKNYLFAYRKLSSSLLQFVIQELPEQSGVKEQVNSFICLHPFCGSSEVEFLHSCEELLEYGQILYSHYFKEMSPVVQRVITYIHQHYAEGVSIKEFCTKSNLNPAYIGSLFKKETGIFFNNYLMQYRICRSISLLCNTEQKINEIAENVGFSSVNYFIMSFKKQLGVSPNKYRSRQIDKM